ncbi:MAG: alpha-L-fucosidase [Acidobacteria bacterium]|nr:alpha-L-fucosidase [Acidobacteriota bacterium]
MKPTCGLALALLLVGSAAAQQRYEPNWESLDSRPAPEWYLDAKLGIFIHWGVYSVPAYSAPDQYAEWYWNSLRAELGPNASEGAVRRHRETLEFHNRVYGKDFAYAQFAPMFKAELFDPAEWADLFRRSGAKYVALTSKHHDGFCMFESKEANEHWGRPWNAVDAGPERDLLGDLGDAVRNAGLKMGFYYSLYEWFNPLWLTDRRLYVERHMIPQFKDVVTRYKPSIIFSDGEWDMPSSEWKSEELLAWLYNESPVKDDVIVNDRWGEETRHHHGGYFTTEYGAGMPDASHPWEENRGMGFSYGYNRNEPLENYRTGKELIWMFADLVARGGNLLLNVGPRADGKIPEIMQQRLLELGAWLDVNGEAIYGTRPWVRPAQWSEGKRPDQGYGTYKVKYDILEMAGQGPVDGRARKEVFFTTKNGTLYAIAAGWPGESLRLRGVRGSKKSTEVRLLGYDQPLAWAQKGDDLLIEVPALGPGQAPSQHAFAFKLTSIDPAGE